MTLGKLTTRTRSAMQARGTKYGR